ncbi:MAG TPA: cupin domain-containing protein [bacterium]|nr:cupin domain-containing protein [bacterium]
MEQKTQAGPTAAELLARTLNANTLVEYAAGAVVSRTVIKRDIGTVTLFAFDKGEGLSEHVAPFDAMVYITDGTAEILIEGQPHRVTQGEFIIMPAHKPHALRAVERFKMLLIMIRG